MPSFSGGPNFRAPFGRNQWLRSTQDVKTRSFTLAASTVTAVTIDGWPNQKVLQPGTVLAKITSGPDAGKVGPVQAGVTDGRQTLANIVGVCNTFLPWQLEFRDVEVAVAYEAVAVQAWCIEYDAGGNSVPLSDATAATMFAQKLLDITFV